MDDKYDPYESLAHHGRSDWEREPRWRQHLYVLIVLGILFYFILSGIADVLGMTILELCGFGGPSEQQLDEVPR